MKKYKIINECREWGMSSVPTEKNSDMLPEKYLIAYHKWKAENGLTGTIDFEFSQPNGFELVVLKVDGFEHRYHVLAKDAIGGINDKVLEKPKIIWYNLPEKTTKQELLIEGEISTEHEITKFELNGNTTILNSSNKFQFKYEMFSGANIIRYYIETDKHTYTSNKVVIENELPIEEDIFRQLQGAKLIPTLKNTSENNIINQRILRYLKNGCFLPGEYFGKYYYILPDELMHKKFKRDLSEILKVFKVENINIGDEFQEFYKHNNLSLGASQLEQWIYIDNMRHDIYKGSSEEIMMYTENYINRLVELAQMCLIRNKREERIYKFYSSDFVILTMLMNNKYEALKEICKPLRNTEF